MQFSVEVLLRENEAVETETVTAAVQEPAGWTDDDVRQVLEAMLQAIRRVKDPAGDPDAPVSFHGLSWIVEPVGEAVVIAIEIPSGAVVAGPFAIAQERLDSLVGRVIAAAVPRRTVIH